MQWRHIDIMWHRKLLVLLDKALFLDDKFSCIVEFVGWARLTSMLSLWDK